MGHLIFDIISISAVSIPTVLIILFIPLNWYLKTNTKLAIKHSTTDHNIEFPRHSVKLLKIWLRKGPENRWALLSRFFFFYTKGNEQIHGQALFRNKKLVDIKFYPPEYQNPDGKFPILSANDEMISGIKPKPSNIVQFPKPKDTNDK